jgi:LmbE family N-acetylglucosaminyl deacetylase
MKIVVLSPHRDDAALALGLTIGAWLGQGHAVEVMNVFSRTEQAPYSDVDSLHGNDRVSFATAVRKREDESWVKLYQGLPGKGRVTLSELNLKDAPLRLHCGLDEVYREPELTEKIVLKLKRALEQSRAAALVLPLGVGGHVDHLTVRQLALPADMNVTPVAFYEEQPYSAQEPALVETAVQESALAAGVPLEAVFAAEPAADIEAAIKRKRRMALCYDSQYEDATAEKIASFSAQYDGRERLWTNAAWRATTFVR